MSRAPQQAYASPARPAYAVIQPSSFSHTSSYSSTSSLASQSSTTSAPMASSSSNAQYYQYYGSSNQQQQQPQPQAQQQQQQQQQQQRILAPQRHPSFEYPPNRQGAGQTAAETTRYLDQAALLAEAAKRAQMACVMRDIGDMEL